MIFVLNLFIVKINIYKGRAMKKALLLVTAAVLITSCAVSKTSKSTIVDLDKVDSEMTINMKLGEVVKIEASSNPSTGYNWNTTFPSGCSVKLEKEDSRNIYNDGRMGAPIVAIYEMKAEQIGECVVEFDYSRSWEGQSKNPKRLKFVVK